MSVHDYLIRKSSVPVTDSHFNTTKRITYYPPGDAAPFELDAASGNDEFLDEQATGSDYKINRVRLRLPTVALKAHGVTSLQASAEIELDGELWNIMYNESFFGRYYVYLQLTRGIMYRQDQLRPYR